ncbi:hypothetical protein [Rossellomorea vietnamensis]|uniref:Uncharacterized protein n=1 Tax=Rossellomorea vietnamensis TaxID=218284 RepID=A0A0P6WFK1_9BACI|nr:hypothetical protein [Rossellomorea vietnamensis]KPL59246.1 hypothetical protein AM506_12015 [Rossellomorea vietnamensis]
MAFGVLSTKVVAGVLAGTVTLGAVGLTFNGAGTIDSVKSQLDSMKEKIVQYEASETSLFEKFGMLKEDAKNKLTFANGKIVEAKNKINDLEAEKSLKIKELAKMTAERDALIAERDQLTTDLEEANKTIAERDAEITSLKQAISDLEGKLAALQSEYDTLLENYNALVAENDELKAEANRANEEVDKANSKVAELEAKSTEVEEATVDAQPMTQDELDAVVPVAEPEVFDAELVVKNLNLTYIQDGQSPDFKAAHSDLDIKEGDRVWRITNNNDFKVYVEYRMAGGGTSGEILANPSQTFYMSGQGGTMIIKWQDENGTWKETVKAGA